LVHSLHNIQFVDFFDDFSFFSSELRNHSLKQTKIPSSLLNGTQNQEDASGYKDGGEHYTDSSDDDDDDDNNDNDDDGSRKEDSRRQRQDRSTPRGSLQSQEDASGYKDGGSITLIVVMTTMMIQE
jgi:hypothetical protein